MPFKRKDSTNWYITVGGVQRTTGTAVKADAEALEAKLNHERWLQDRMGVKPPKSWEEAVLQRGKEAKGKKSWETERIMLKWWTVRLAGVADINTITREMVDDIVQKDRPVDVVKPCSANTTANKYVGALSCVLRAAEYEWSWGNRAPKLRVYPNGLSKDVCPEPAQILDLVGELPEHSADIALYAVATMHRRANITGLEWSMIDWAKEAVKVAGQLTKTGKPIYVPLNKTAMGVLIKRKNATVRHPRLVFHYDGNPIHNVTTKAWKKACKRVGITENVTLHTMRHCGNSWLAQRAVPKEIRAQLGGWSITGRGAIDDYTHLFIDHLRPYAAMLDEVLRVGQAARKAA